jgi:hypothetical protein
MNYVKITCDNGDHWTTGINATLEEACEYFVGKVFVDENPETGEEARKTVVSCEVAA